MFFVCYDPIAGILGLNPAYASPYASNLDSFVKSVAYEHGGFQSLQPCSTPTIAAFCGLKRASF